MNNPDKREALVEWAKKEVHHWPLWATVGTLFAYETGTDYNIARLLDELNYSFYRNPILTTVLFYGSCKVIPKILRAGKEVLKKIRETRMAAKNIFVLHKNNEDAKRLMQLCEGDLRSLFQMDLFPEEEEKWMEEMREKWIKHEDEIPKREVREEQQEFEFNAMNKESVCQNGGIERTDKDEIIRSPRLYLISRPSDGGENAVILQSDFDLPKSPRLGGVTKYKKGLMRMFGLKDLRVFIVANATRTDLMMAMGNRDIHHIVVDGHGTWGSWIESEGREITNEELKNTSNTKKKSFVRHTCGHPTTDNKYVDQLGTPVADYIFGNSKIQTNLDISLNPLLSASSKVFNDSKTRTPEGNSTFSAKIVNIRKAILDSFLEDIGFLKKK